MIDLKSTTETQKNVHKLLKNRDWLEDNFKTIQEKYVDKWVVVADQKVQGFGDTPDEAKENIPASFSSVELVILRVPEGEVSRPV